MDEISGIYFIERGSAAYVIPRHNNAIYSRVGERDMLGYEDIIYNLNMSGIICQNTDINELQLQKRDVGYRKFTLISVEATQAFELPLSEVLKIQLEFPSAIKLICN
jgi:hypothetical protein